MAEGSQHRGQHHHGVEARQRRHRQPGVGEAPEEGDVEDEHGAEGDRHRHGGEQHGPPGGGHRPPHGHLGLVIHQFLAVAAHHEERVVDGEAQPHCGGEVEGEHGHVGELVHHEQGQEGRHHREGADGEREGSGHHAPEDEEQEQHAEGDGDHLRPEQVGFHRAIDLGEHRPLAAHAHHHGGPGIVPAVVLVDVLGELHHQVVGVGVAGEHQGPVTGLRRQGVARR